MAYFLKKSNLKKGVYLQIYESFYDSERKETVHKSHKALGYVNELKQRGIEDPISFYKAEVDKLNSLRTEQLQADKQRHIGDQTPEKYLGYFLLKNLNDSLGVKCFLDLLQTTEGFKFNVYSLLSALIYSRAVYPCSKSKTYDEVLPKLFEDYDFSLNQMYSGLEYIGSEYEKIIELYNEQLNKKYPFVTTHTYFDCTNFYFEIDKEDELRRKGPSKENRKDPIVGLGLLLDACQIPIGMKIYPGNESEKPIIRSVIDGLKQRHNISGRTIQIADKGLNCGDNIFHAVKSGDGYIFSKSVKQLPDTEEAWVLLDNGYVDVKDESGKTIYRIKECRDTFKYDITDDAAKGGKRKISIDEKRIVTYNPELAKKQRYEINREIEKAKKLKASSAKKSEYGDSAKYVVFTTADKNGNQTEGTIKVTLNESKIQHDLALAGYNMLVTSELNMASKDIYEAYHNLWRIEESFRIMKSQLDARPVYLQKKETITGHFLICYLAVLLIRIMQFKVLKNKYSSESICSFIRNFKVAKISERKYINLTRNSEFIQSLTKATHLPLLLCFLNNTQINSILNNRF